MATTVRSPSDAAYQHGTVVRAAAPRDLPSMRSRERRKPFTIAFHPKRWTHIDGKGWAPDIIVMQHSVGANGVTQTGHGPNATIDATSLQIGMARKHGVVVQPGDPRLPEDLRWYVTKIELRGGGHHYAPIWESVGVIAGKARKRIDEDLRDRFVKACIDAGIVRPMAAEVLEDKLSILDNRLGGLMQDRVGGPNVERLIERATAKREAMVADWAKQFDAEEAA